MTDLSSQLTDRLTAYAAQLRESGAIRTNAVETAFATVPRHLFLPRFQYRGDPYTVDPNFTPADVLDIVYANNSLLTRTGRDGDPPSSSSTPSVMAKMLEALDLRPGLRVLEIGAGTGYNAALINAITGTTVISVEAGQRTSVDASAAIASVGLAGQVQVIHGDGYLGHPVDEPYDRIIVTCGIAGIPPGWLDQLAADGLIVAPVAHAGVHPIMVAERHGPDDITAQVLMWGDFMPASGPLRPTELFAHDPAEEIPASGARTILDASQALTLDGYHDLWCYLGVQDRRATRAYPDREIFDLATGTCALVDPTIGTAWIHQNGTITAVGGVDPGAYLATLVELWGIDDQPKAADWLVTLAPINAGPGDLLIPRDWHLAS